LNTVFLSICAIVEEYESFLKFAHIGFPENWDELLTEPRVKAQKQPS